MTGFCATRRSCQRDSLAYLIKIPYGAAKWNLASKAENMILEDDMRILDRKIKLVYCFMLGVLSMNLNACESRAGAETAEETAEGLSDESRMESDCFVNADVSERETETDEEKEHITSTEEKVGEEDLLYENPALSNPIRAVESPKDFETIGLRLLLPENEDLYSNASCSTIGESVAQIQFYDEIAKSNALVRAGKEEDGNPSGIYYIFDSDKTENWIAMSQDGNRIEITVEMTTANSDVHGVLASWNYNGINYSLWEDGAGVITNMTAKMAIAIAEESSGVL